MAPGQSEIAAHRIRLRERERVGQELHDGLCQSLFGLSCELEALARQAAADRSPHTPVLDRAAEILSRAVAETREVARGYLPDEAHAPDALLAALRRLAESTGEKVWCELRGQLGSWPLAREQAAEVYRIAREALANAVKHAGAQRILLTIDADEEAVTLRIEDDGRGFSPSSLEPRGLGLKIMRRRAALLGGRLEIESRLGAGTAVVCTVPNSSEL